MKLRSSLKTLYIRKDALQTGRSVLYAGDVRVKTGLLGAPLAIRGLSQSVGTFVEYRAVRVFAVKLNKRKQRKV